MKSWLEQAILQFMQYDVITCPSCSSENIKKNGTTRQKNKGIGAKIAANNFSLAIPTRLI